MDVMHLPGPDLPWGTVTEAPRSDGNLFLLLSLLLYLAGRCCDNFQSTKVLLQDTLYGFETLTFRLIVFVYLPFLDYSLFVIIEIFSSRN